jgi:tRNA dimethylallyltransferase
MLEHVEHHRPLEECRTDVVNHTRRFARRQRSWFGRDPRIRWVAGGPGFDRQKQAVLAEWRRETG